jgi:hypothetical protein
VDFNAVGGSYARRNENNQDQPDGVYYLGRVFWPGYGVLNAGARHPARKHMRLFVQIDSLLDHRYYTAAQLGPAPFDNAAISSRGRVRRWMEITPFARRRFSRLARRWGLGAESCSTHHV